MSLRTFGAIIFAIMITACGGDGGGSSSTMDPMVTPSGPRLERLNQNALLLVGDAYIYARVQGQSENLVADSVCSATGCTLTEPVTGYSERLTIQGLLGSSDPVTDDLEARLRRTGNRNGIDIYSASFPVSVEGQTFNARGLGFWMEHNSGFAIVGDTTLSGTFIEVGYGAIVGNRSDSVPSISATYEGAMVGINTRGSRRGSSVQGDARIDFTARGANNSSVDVHFSNISGASTNGFSWSNIPVRSDGIFQTGSINGSFFGPNHEEIAGTFHGFDIVGAYGAKR